MAQGNQKNTKVNPRHRRQFFWQILLPIVLSVLVVIAIAVLIALPSSQTGLNTGQYAAVSLILLIIPVLLLICINILITVGLIYLIAKLLRNTPVYSRLVGLYIQIAAIRLGTVLDYSVKPFFKVHGWLAGWKAFFHQLKG